MLTESRQLILLESMTSIWPYEALHCFSELMGISIYYYYYLLCLLINHAHVSYRFSSIAARGRVCRQLRGLLL
jgi:hypothetical protein